MSVIKDWLTTFVRLMIKPTPQTFVAESTKAKGKFNSTVVWLVLSASMLNIWYLVFYNRFSLLSFIISILFIPILFLFFVFCTHSLYRRLFGRKKDYHSQLLYLMTGSCVPILLINPGIAEIPVVGIYLSWISIIYLIILFVMTVKTVTNLTTWQSFIIILLSIIAAGVAAVLIPIFIISLVRTVPGIF